MYDDTVYTYTRPLLNFGYRKCLNKMKFHKNVNT